MLGLPVPFLEIKNDIMQLISQNIIECIFSYNQKN